MVTTINNSINAVAALIVFYGFIALKVSYIVYTGQYEFLVHPTIVDQNFPDYLEVQRFMDSMDSLNTTNIDNYLIYTTYMVPNFVQMLPQIPDFTNCPPFNLLFLIYYPFSKHNYDIYEVIDLQNNIPELARHIAFITRYCVQLNSEVENSARMCRLRGYDDYEADDYMMGKLDSAKSYVRGLRVIEQIMRQFNSHYVSALPACEFED